MHWDIIGAEVINSILYILNNGLPLDAINFTDLIMIPKRKNPETPLDFRPISSSNVVYKLLSKVLVNRRKPFMRDLISDTQGVFVHDRSIYDNILVADEVAHSMKGKRSGHGCFVKVKLDMSKAYDRID